MRADAARNHRAVLDAAAGLVAEIGAEQVSLDRVAQAAGVGKGTVLRRFGSRAGLLAALLEQRAEAIRADLARPPDTPPRERLLALLDALGALAADNASLFGQACAVDRYSDPTYRTWHHHVVAMLTAIDPGLDADAVAHLLLATIDGHLVHRLGRARFAAAQQALVATLAGHR